METNQSLRDRLAEIDEQIALLEAEKKIVQRKLGSITYPVLSLPFEVTSKIFVHCLPDFQDSDRIFSRYPVPTPLLLSQICRTWRFVAFTTPKIWAVFNIHSFDIDQAKNHVFCTRRFAEWVQRIGSLPLSFILHRSLSLNPTSSDIFNSLLSLSMQWQDVD
ncbi:hypothetical protein B0H13DRAFT_585909, partial [Mycena leptocephala]